MNVTVVLLGYAVVVAVLAPRLLGGAWLSRSPRLALLLWHAVAASALIAVVLTGVICLHPEGPLMSGGHLEAGPVTAGAGLLVPALAIVRLAVVLARLIRVQHSERAQQVKILGLLGRHDWSLGATVIPSTTPAAYCLPRPGRIVVTDAAIAVLHGNELRAVLAHERGHLAGRHHLIVSWATALACAFPYVPIFRALKAVTATMVEVLADDHAVRHESRDSLVDAIAVLGLGRHHDGSGVASGLAATGGSALVRVNRLLDPPPPLPLSSRVGGVGAAVSLLAVPALAIVLPVVAVVCPPLFG